MTSPGKPSKSSPFSRSAERHAGSTGTQRPIGLENEDDWFDDRLEHPEFLRRMAEARRAFAEGHGVKQEDLPS